MPRATLTSKGQITIPKEIRAALGLETGDHIAIRLVAADTAEMKTEKTDLLSLCGAIKPKIRGVTLNDFDKALLKETHYKSP
jgi:antitoxin PrlF